MEYLLLEWMKWQEGEKKIVFLLHTIKLTTSFYILSRLVRTKRVEWSTSSKGLNCTDTELIELQLFSLSI